MSLQTIGISLLDNLLSPSKKQFYYLRENGDATPATILSITWLLRREKDLAAAFNKEPKSNIETYKKYLLLINERYATKHQ